MLGGLCRNWIFKIEANLLSQTRMRQTTEKNCWNGFCVDTLLIWFFPINFLNILLVNDWEWKSKYFRCVTKIQKKERWLPTGLWLNEKRVRQQRNMNTPTAHTDQFLHWRKDVWMVWSCRELLPLAGPSKSPCFTGDKIRTPKLTVTWRFPRRQTNVCSFKRTQCSDLQAWCLLCNSE